jgi:hypothetical protein
LLGPPLSGSRGALPERPSIGGLSHSVWGAGAAPKAAVGPNCLRVWCLLGASLPLTLCAGGFMAPRPPCLAEELWCAPPCRHFVWEMGRRATWSKSGGGEAAASGVRGSGPLMAVGGPEESRIPSSPMRRRARSGQHAWCKVERGLNSSSMPS